VAEQGQATYDYESIDPGYYDHVFRRGAGVQSKWHHAKFKVVRDHMPADYQRHLDVGCGPGTFIGTLPDDRNSTGTDVADPQIQYALREYKTESHDFQCIPPGDLPFEDNTFDVVTIVEIIEHLEVPVIEALLQEVLRVLVPGGRVILTTPNYGSLWPFLEKVVNARADVTYEDQHITFFKRARLRAFLERAGFADSAARTFQGAAPFAAALSWKLADLVQIVENPLLSPAMGFLLLGSGTKPGSAHGTEHAG